MTEEYDTNAFMIFVIAILHRDLDIDRARRQRVCGGALRRQPAGDEQSQVPRDDFR